jgi:hypothetical protein
MRVFKCETRTSPKKYSQLAEITPHGADMAGTRMWVAYSEAVKGK